MRLALALLIAVSLPLCLTACGGEEESGSNDTFNPYDGKSFDFNKLQQDPEKIREMMRDGKMPGFDPKELKRELEKVQMPTNETEARDFLKRMGGTISEAELESWWTVSKGMHDANQAGDREEAGRIMLAAGGGQFALLTGKVMMALRMYELRKKQGALTDADKQMATVYDKYLKLYSGLKK